MLVIQTHFLANDIFNIIKIIKDLIHFNKRYNDMDIHMSNVSALKYIYKCKIYGGYFAVGYI